MPDPPLQTKDHFQRNVRPQLRLGDLFQKRVIANPVFEVPVGMGCWFLYALGLELPAKCWSFNLGGEAPSCPTLSHF